MSLSIIDLGIDFHGEEEAEIGVGSECVKLLFQLHQPLRSQVYVLQQDPATCTHQVREVREVREEKNSGYQTYRPAFEADKMAFSARLKPSAEPEVTHHHMSSCIRYCEGATDGKDLGVCT